MYYPLFKSMGKIISKNLNLLYVDNEVKNAFTPKPMISFHSARKMSNYMQKKELKVPLSAVVRIVRFV